MRASSWLPTKTPKCSCCLKAHLVLGMSRQEVPSPVTQGRGRIQVQVAQCPCPAPQLASSSGFLLESHPTGPEIPLPMPPARWATLPQRGSEWLGKGVRNWGTVAPPTPPDSLEAVPFQFIINSMLEKQMF